MKRNSLTFTNTLSWNPDDSTPCLPAPLRLALHAFQCALSMLDSRISLDDLHWFTEEVNKIAKPYLLPGSSSWSTPSGSGWSGSR